MASSRRRKDHPEYEFSRNLIVEALKNAEWCCEQCGIDKWDTDQKYLEAHHRVYVSTAIDYKLPHEIINNLANIEILCNDCHLKEHQTPQDMAEVNWLLSQFAIQLKLL